MIAVDAGYQITQSLQITLTVSRHWLWQQQHCVCMRGDSDTNALFIASRCAVTSSRAGPANLRDTVNARPRRCRRWKRFVSQRLSSHRPLQVPCTVEHQNIMTSHLLFARQSRSRAGIHALHCRSLANRYRGVSICKKTKNASTRRRINECNDILMMTIMLTTMITHYRLENRVDILKWKC